MTIRRRLAGIGSSTVWDVSEQGWRDFLSAVGGGDWVVLHGGATASYRVESMVDAARLAASIAALPAASGVLMTISDATLTVRLSRDVWQLESEHVELARAVTQIARDLGAKADRSRVQEVQVAVASKPDALDVGFWRAVLGYEPMADDNAVDPLGHSSTIWMQPLDDNKSLRHAMHVDVSLAREQAEARLAAALQAGGRIVDDSEAPGTWILADQAGNKVCIASWPDGAVPTSRG